jgi:hypothetical protein
MSKTKCTNAVLSLPTAAMAIMSLAFAVTASLPAEARDARSAQFAQPNRYFREHIPNHRYFNYAGPMRPGSIYVPGAVS